MVEVNPWAGPYTVVLGGPRASAVPAANASRSASAESGSAGFASRGAGPGDVRGAAGRVRRGRFTAPT
jgi:hypothetical protein